MQEMLLLIETRLVQIRKQLHLTQAEFAKKIGVSKKTIINWENGSPPSIDNLKNLCLRVHVSADYLLGIKGYRAIDLSDMDEEDQIIAVALIQCYRESKKMIGKTKKI